MQTDNGTMSSSSSVIHALRAVLYGVGAAASAGSFWTSAALHVPFASWDTEKHPRCTAVFDPGLVVSILVMMMLDSFNMLAEFHPRQAMGVVVSHSTLLVTWISAFWTTVIVLGRHCFSASIGLHIHLGWAIVWCTLHALALALRPRNSWITDDHVSSPVPSVASQMNAMVHGSAVESALPSPGQVDALVHGLCAAERCRLLLLSYRRPFLLESLVDEQHSALWREETHKDTEPWTCVICLLGAENQDPAPDSVTCCLLDQHPDDGVDVSAVITVPNGTARIAGGPQSDAVTTQHQQPRTVTLRCTHQFHILCLARWLTRSGSCPICREPCNALGEQPKW